MLTELLPDSPSKYPKFLKGVYSLPKAERKAILRWLCRNDLYFLLRFVLSTSKIVDKDGNCRWDHPWAFARVREIQANPNGYIDIWAREHLKSSSITFGLSILDILNDPEITIGIFSHSRPIAKRFLRQIKTEFEDNKELVRLFPDILWADPKTQSPKWSEDDGLRVKRKGNPAAETVEAWGLIDGQPTGKHFKLRVYDDVVDEDTVTTPEMISKVTKAWELSSNLGMEGGWVRYIGTRYHAADTYAAIMERDAAIPRIYPAHNPPKPDGEPVLYSREYLERKFKEQGAFTYAAQMLCNPLADDAQGFAEEWLQYYDADPTEERKGKNVYILVDAANEKKRRSDFTAIWVLGLGDDHNYYVLDIYRDRWNLVERTDKLFELHALWKPNEIRYEEYGMTTDIEHIRYVQDRRSYRFHITPVAGRARKNDRIRRLIPLFQEKRIYFPRELKKKDYQKKTYDAVKVFVQEEYKVFPVGLHDDMFDSLSRIAEPDLPVLWPFAGQWREEIKDAWERPERKPQVTSSWMAG